MSILQFIIYLPAVIGITIIALLSLFRRSARGMLSFAAMSFSMALWLFVQFLAQTRNFESYDLLLVQAASAISVFIGYFFLIFIKSYTTEKHASNLQMILLLLPFLILSPLNFSGYMITQVEITDLGIAVQEAGILYFIEIAIIGLYFIWGLTLLVRNTFRKRKALRLRNYLLLFAIFQAVVLSILSTTIFATVAVAQLLIPFSMFFMTLLIAYSIIKHHLFDIRSIVARSLAYTLLVATIGLIYGVIVFEISRIFFDGEVLSTTQQFVYIILAIFVAFTFQPLRHFFEKLTDKIFYRDRYDTQYVLNQINSILTSQIDLNIITNSTNRIICESLRLSSGTFMVLDGDKIYQKSEYGVNNIKLEINDLAKEIHQNLLVADEIEDGHIRDLMIHDNISAVMRLKTQEGVVGYILLGPKKSGSIYTDQDYKLLEILVDELAIAVQNAMSFEKIADFNITLQKRIEEATKRLRVQNRKLKELDEAKDEFISMASHQLRTPLTSIKGYLSMLTEGDGGKLTKKQFDFADNAFVSAQRMVFLISDMLNVSRINTGKLVIEKTPLDLDLVVRDEIKQLQRTAESRNAKLNYIPPTEKLPQISLDEGKMRQVIMNFIDNAIYYAPESTIEVSLQIVEHKIRFSVVDHGIGVPKEAQKHLFTKFYRAGNAQKARPDGTGLGLYMAKMVVEMQGGNIIFHSEEGKGSTFGFEFPLELVQASSTAATTKVKAPVQSR